MSEDSSIVGQHSAGRQNVRSNRARRRAGLPLLLGWLLGPLVARGAEPVPQLRGVMAVGDAWFASFVVTEQRRQEWRRVGDRFSDFVILSIDAESATLLNSQGERHVVSLPHSLVVNRHAPPTEPAARQVWVDSRDNPMLLQPADLPVDARRWRELPDTRRREITAWYEAHGWKLAVAFDRGGVPDIEFAPLQGERRQAMVAEKQHAFLRALSPEQRTLHTAATVRGKHAPQPSEAAGIAFEASLPPLQRDAFRSLGDFTSPLPR